jgi:hypothetical protein
VLIAQLCLLLTHSRYRDGGPETQDALGWVGRGRHDVRWYGMEPLFRQITPGEGCFLDALWGRLAVAHRAGVDLLLLALPVDLRGLMLHVWRSGAALVSTTAWTRGGTAPWIC